MVLKRCRERKTKFKKKIKKKKKKRKKRKKVVLEKKVNSGFLFSFERVQPMMSAPNNSSLLSDQDTNQFLV